MADGLGLVGLAYCLKAMHKQRIHFATIAPTVSVSRFRTWSKGVTGRPALALIADDGAGPCGWPVADRVVDWSKTILIHAAVQEVFHYEIAIQAAETSLRCLIIECGEDTLGAWLELVMAARHMPVTHVVMPESGHLVPLAR